MTTPTTERFTARESTQRYHGWGVHDGTEDVFVWARGHARDAEHLAAFLNAIVPDGMHAWAVRRMLAPVSDIVLADNGLVRADGLVRRSPDGSYPAVALDPIGDGPHVNYEA